jgi:GNAT superfamily N-acetyltransferase
MRSPCVERLGLAHNPASLQAERWDGSLSPLNVVEQPLTLRLGGQLDCELRPHCAETLPYDLILGKPWLRKWNPHINWQTDTLMLFNKESKKTIRLAAEDVEKASPPPFVITAKQLKRFTKGSSKTPIFMVRVDHVGLKDSEKYCEYSSPATGVETGGPSVKTGVPLKGKTAMHALIEEFSDVFPDELPVGLPPKRKVDLKIDLLPDSKPVKRPIYKLSEEELKELKSQIDELLEKGFIRPSTSTWASSILFVPKKDGGLRMCIDYRALNKATIRNNYPLPRIDEVWDQIGGSKYFSTLDLRSGYNQIRVADEDVHKTCFRTRYGAYEFLVVPFGLSGAPPVFQALMNEVLRPYLDEFCLVYLDDILIYSKTEEEHIQHLRSVLNKLRDHRLYAKLSKCELFKPSLLYLGHHISASGIGVEEKKISAIRNWVRPRTLVNLQSFLGLCNYYRKFVMNFSQIAAPLTDLTKRDTPYTWGEKQESAFTQLKEALMSAPILRCADSSLPFQVQADASETGLGAILQQKDENGIRPVAYMSRKLNAAEQNYPPHERELLAVVDALREWRCYLMGRKFLVKTDHRPLQYLQTQQTLSRRQARWVLFLQNYDFDWEYVTGKSNGAADALSRQEELRLPATWESLQQLKPKALYTLSLVDYEQQTSLNLATINAISVVKPKLVSDLREAYVTDTEFSALFANPEPPYQIRDECLFKGDALCIPKGTLRDIILHDHHDAVSAGHRGVAKTLAAIRRSYYWPTLKSDVTTYVRSCGPCQRSKAVRQAKAGLLRPFPPPQKKWEVITMDFVFDLPLTDTGNNGIAVVVDKLSKQAHFLAISPKFDAIELARVYLHEVYRHHGLPRILISDRDVRFTSLFWTTLMDRLGVKLNLSSAYHPETDGQTERTIGTFEELIRPYVSYLQTDWDKFIDPLEFAYNNSLHESTGQTPFHVVYGQHPVTLDDVLTRPLPKASDSKLEPPAVQKLLEANKNAANLAQEVIKRTNERMLATVNRQRRDLQFQVGDLVLLSTANLKLPLGTKRVKKLAPKYIGPFEVLERVADGRAYRIDLPSHMRLHPTFHVSSLRPYVVDTVSGRAQAAAKPDYFADGHHEFEVEAILDHRKVQRQLQYFVSWVGMPDHENAWLPSSSMDNAKELIQQYWDTKPTKPQQTKRRRRTARGRASS